MQKAFMLVELVVVVAMLALLAVIAVPNYRNAQTQSKVARVQSAQRSMATGLEAYNIDHGTFPLHWPRSAGAVGAWSGTGAQPTHNINRALRNAAGWTGYSSYDNVPSFAVCPNAGHGFGLTTPVAYLPAYTVDEFAEFPKATFSFASFRAQFLVWSPGPDGKDALDGIDASGSTPTNVNSAEYIVAGPAPLPSRYLIAGPMGVVGGKPPSAPGFGGAFTYDPTNGLLSQGDVWRVRSGREQ